MSKLRFAVAVPGLPFQGDSLEKQSLGGSETAGLCLMRELAALGHQVLAFTNTNAPGMYDGVRYIPFGAFQRFATECPHDVTVAQRVPELFGRPFDSKLSVMWAHDLALKRSKNTVRGSLWNIDKIAVVSAFMAAQYREVYGVKDEQLYVTRNGLDLKMFKGLDKIERYPKDLIYTARPERGLDVLLNRVFPKLLERDPELTLYLAGYENVVEQMKPFYAEMGAKVASFGGKVINLGYLTKADLYKRFASAGCMVYPTPSPISPTFREVSCITAMEAMASGLPFVSTDRGALSETLAEGAGTLIPGDPMTDEYVSAFCDAVIGYTSKPAKAKAAAKAGRAKAATLDWAGVAKEWAADCERFIEERNDSKERLARHFVRRSNIILAKDLVKDMDSPSAKSLKAWLDKDWAFVESPEAYKEQYNKIGETHTDAFEGGSREQRLQRIIKWFRAHPEIKSVVDVGCGLGIYAINLSNACPDLKITGVDVDVKTIEWAHGYRDKYAKHPDNLTFVVGREDAPLTGFDCGLACEVLEHVTEPWDFLNKLQGMVKPGGHCYLTVPYGPWEALSYGKYPHRAHLWEYDPQDLEEMLAGKPKQEIDFAPCGQSPDTEEAMGHLHFAFITNGEPFPKIDIARKLRLQRPRETLSVIIMAGGPQVEETVHWCLRSVRAVADELIVADCGLTEEGRRIVEEYADVIFEAPNPTEAGFETPRNMALDRASMDWVLWIDTDERLLNPEGLGKYLKRSAYAGYSIRQHHFSVDANFPADMPVRLFRRNRDDGKTMKFIGMLHEHPETDLNEGPGEVLILPDEHIAHLGYLTERIRRQRFLRNNPLLKKDEEAHPTRLLRHHFIIRDNLLLAGYHLQLSGNVITAEVRQLCEEAVEIYREHFMGKRQYAGVDSLQYYSQALQILGVGFDVSFDVKATRDGQQAQDPTAMNGPRTARFASLEEAQAELAQKLKDVVEPLDGETW